MFQDVWEDEAEICAQLEPVFLQAVVFVLENNVMDLYEDVFKLVTSLTMTRISPDMWKIFEMLYKVRLSGLVSIFTKPRNNVFLLGVENV